VATNAVWTADTNHTQNPTCVYVFTYDEGAALSGQVDDSDPDCN
jgi:hypothetical protein